jgi:hypothetical protein
MTDVTWRPSDTLAPLSEPEREQDRFGELLECLADLLVATARRKDAIDRVTDGSDPRVREALDRMLALEREMLSVCREAASVHQMLAHLRLV